MVAVGQTNAPNARAPISIGHHMIEAGQEAQDVGTDTDIDIVEVAAELHPKPASLTCR